MMALANNNKRAVEPSAIEKSLPSHLNGRDFMPFGWSYGMKLY
jgi:hypothetical protein